MPRDPADSWTWEQYEAYLGAEWPRVLADHADDEKAIHRFLEKHPCLLPGAEGGDTSIGGHHGPLPRAVISEPPLQAIGTKVPDFMWITKMSSVMKPVLIEIEAPAKAWFRPRAPVQAAELTDAINQVSRWRDWFEDDENRLVFFRQFNISNAMRESFKVDPVYTLIYGRRSEFETDPDRSRLRESFRPSWLEWMTFDRLKPLYGARNWITIRHLKGSWRVVAVPPTFDIGPGYESYVAGLAGLGEAIEANELVTTERKARLHDLSASMPSPRW